MKITYVILTKIAKIKEQLEKIGYDTRMLFINTNLETTLQRNQDRFDKEGGRKVDQEMATGIWKQTQDNMMKYQQVFGADSFFIIDNSGGLEDPNRKRNFETVYNELQKFINSKPTQAIAIDWLKSNKEKKQYNSPVSSTQPEDEGDFYSTSTFKSRGGSARQTSDFAKRAVLAKGKEKITSFSPPD